MYYNRGDGKMTCNPKEDPMPTLSQRKKGNETTERADTLYSSLLQRKFFKGRGRILEISSSMLPDDDVRNKNR